MEKEISVKERHILRAVYGTLIILVLGICLIVATNLLINTVKGIEIVDRDESRLEAIAEHLSSDKSEIIIENSFFSSTYNITFNGSQYKAQFNYNDKGNAAVTNFSLVND